MRISIYTGEITNPKRVSIDDSITLSELIEQQNLVGEIQLNGSSLNGTNRNTKLADLGVKANDYLCYARKNGGN